MIPRLLLSLKQRANLLAKRIENSQLHRRPDGEAIPNRRRWIERVWVVLAEIEMTGNFSTPDADRGYDLRQRTAPNTANHGAGKEVGSSAPQRRHVFVRQS